MFPVCYQTNHLCFLFKYLKRKPCVDLKKDEYLKISIPEQENLIPLKFDTHELKNFHLDSKNQEAEATTTAKIK